MFIFTMMFGKELLIDMFCPIQVDFIAFLILFLLSSSYQAHSVYRKIQSNLFQLVDAADMRSGKTRGCVSRSGSWGSEQG